MREEIAVRRPILRYERGEVRETEEEIATERPVTIVLNGEEFATLVCSPDHVEDLAIGYLASEGAAYKWDGSCGLSYDERSGYVYADVPNVSSWISESGSKRYLTSCCGKSRQSFVFYGDARTARPVAGRTVALGYEDCSAMIARLQESSTLFRSTGGVHNAALFDRDGAMLLSRMDIGRHNALDKIYGYCLRTNMDMSGKALAFSGRVSSEVLLKAAKMQVEALLSKSAATDLAIELAEELGITVVGFIRGQSMNVYAHPSRVGIQGGD